MPVFKVQIVETTMTGTRIPKKHLRGIKIGELNIITKESKKSPLRYNAFLMPSRVRS